ncbi:TPA: glycosyltransferase [Candidatus Micrarchaeota archaeon]|nr:glycosyltransferase [Candidatus Micrarchaeota archaeon]
MGRKPGLALSRIAGKRIRQQQGYLQRHEGIIPSSKNPAHLSMLYRLNGLRQGYLQELNEISRSLPPMHPNCKLSVVIPAHMEQENISRVLEGWTTRQHEADPTAFELIVLVNRPTYKKPWDNTAARIAEFKKKHPQYKIHVVQKTFNFPKENTNLRRNGVTAKVDAGVRMGLIFKLASDLSLYRNLERRNNPQAKASAIANHTILTSGADVIGRHPKFVKWMTKTIEDRPEIDYIKPGYGYPPAVAKIMPLLWAFHDYRNAFADAYHGTKPRRHGAIRSFAYAAIGGFKHGQDVAEEIELGKSLAMLHPQILQQPFTGVLDNPRRSLEALLAGKSVVGEYRDFGIKTLMKLSTGRTSQLPATAQFTEANLSREITSHLNAYLKRQPNKTEKTRAVSLARKALENMGLRPGQYEITGSGEDMQVRIKTLEPIRRRIEEYSRIPKATWLAQAKVA